MHIARAEHAHNVEFGVEDIDALHNPIEVRHRERCVALVLAHCVRVASDFLERARDDEICRLRQKEASWIAIVVDSCQCAVLEARAREGARFTKIRIAEWT